MIRALLICICTAIAVLSPSPVNGLFAQDPTEGLVGYWKLQGDARDYSGKNNHGTNHGVDLATADFNGRDAYIEIPQSESLQLGTSDFAITAWVWTAEELDDVIGDVIDWYDPDQRRGVTLCMNSSAGGYQSQGSDRHVYFGIDNAKLSEWQDCGRPNETSNYVANSMTVYNGHLYVATIDAQEEANWCHVYRYDGDQRWIDCGRVGNGRTPGVLPLIVHDGQLYAATTTYDWTRVREGDYDPGRVYRYVGGMEWEDCGQPSSVNQSWNCFASFKGKLYIGGGWQQWGVFSYEGDQRWNEAKLFPKSGPLQCFPHCMGRYNGKLYVGWAGVHAFDGNEWNFAGVPIRPVERLQMHSLEVHQGSLCAGTWPEAKVARYRGGEEWEDIGRVGEDGTEVNALVVYNGKLYGGSIPRAELCRYDGAPQWTSLKRFYSPDDWQPVPPAPVGGNPTREQVAEWTRLTSLTVYNGRLFASIGSCTSSILDAPADVRGKVFSIEAGKCLSYDLDVGPGWKHLVAVRNGGQLKLYIQGRLAAVSTEFNSESYDLTLDQPLRIGFGQTDYFNGKIAGVRLYRRALSDMEVEKLALQPEYPQQ